MTDDRDIPDAPSDLAWSSASGGTACTAASVMPATYGAASNACANTIACVVKSMSRPPAGPARESIM